METTRNTLPPHIQKFFADLKSFIGVPLYYYGSVQRPDFIPTKSDIDVDIFTHNVDSMVGKLHHYLNRPLSKFHKTLMYLNKKVISGYKVFYKHVGDGDDDDNTFSAEFAIFNEVDKDAILKEHLRKMDLPFYITFLLVLTKWCYYIYGILDKKQYKMIKNTILSTFIGIEATPYAILKNS